MKTCQIEIRDEVNVKFVNLDADTRRKLAREFSFEIPGARFMPAVRLGRWDGRESFFSVAGTSYINLLPEILPIIEKAGYDFELIDHRDYQRHFTFDQVTNSTFANRTWPEGHAAAGKPIELRDYQIEAINRFLANPQSLQQLATGFGKTITCAAMSMQCEKWGRTVIIVPNKSLVSQTEADYKNLGLDTGVFYGDRKELTYQHTICTWQSLNNLLKTTRANTAEVTISEFVEGVVCVIVDECHTLKASALKSLLTGPFAQVPIRWGLTGTIPKEKYEYMSLLCSVGAVMGELSARELQSDGYLANCHVNIVQFVDHKEFKDWPQEQKYLLESNDRLTAIAQLVARVKQSGNTLVLVDRVAAGKALVACLGDQAVFVSGATKASARKEEYDEIATADNKIIVATYGVAAVGINIPRLFNIVLLEPGKSFVRVIQSIGRGLRKAQDKDHVEIWDIASTCRFSKRHLQKRVQYYAEAGYPYSKEKLNWQD